MNISCDVHICSHCFNWQNEQSVIALLIFKKNVSDASKQGGEICCTTNKTKKTMKMDSKCVSKGRLGHVIALALGCMV